MGWFRFPRLSFVFPSESLCNYILQNTSNDGQDDFRMEEKPKIEINVCAGAAESYEQDVVLEVFQSSVLLCLIWPR